MMGMLGGEGVETQRIWASVKFNDINIMPFLVWYRGYAFNLIECARVLGTVAIDKPYRLLLVTLTILKRASFDTWADHTPPPSPPSPPLSSKLSAKFQHISPQLSTVRPHQFGFISQSDHFNWHIAKTEATRFSREPCETQHHRLSVLLCNIRPTIGHMNQLEQVKRPTEINTQKWNFKRATN